MTNIKKLNQISSTLNLTSLQLIFSEELFVLKSRPAQLHGAVRQFLDTDHENDNSATAAYG